MSGVIHTDDVKHQLRDVDAEHAHLLCHGTRLLWSMVAHDIATILAHRSCTGMRRVHFIITRPNPWTRFADTTYRGNGCWPRWRSLLSGGKSFLGHYRSIASSSVAGLRPGMKSGLPTTMPCSSSRRLCCGSDLQTRPRTARAAPCHVGCDSG